MAPLLALASDSNWQFTLTSAHIEIRGEGKDIFSSLSLATSITCVTWDTADEMANRNNNTHTHTKYKEIANETPHETLIDTHTHRYQLFFSSSSLLHLAFCVALMFSLERNTKKEQKKQCHYEQLVLCIDYKLKKREQLIDRSLEKDWFRLELRCLLVSLFMLLCPLEIDEKGQSTLPSLEEWTSHPMKERETLTHALQAIVLTVPDEKKTLHFHLSTFFCSLFLSPSACNYSLFFR